MIRQIIKIDEEKCNGCGACANACHEGAIDMVNGKAKLVREHFCDGLGDCLPECPTGAITFETREAPEYDEAAVLKSQKKFKNIVLRKNEVGGDEIDSSKSDCHVPGTGCPGSKFVDLGNREIDKGFNENKADNNLSCETKTLGMSRLEQWPVQIKLLPIKGDFYDGAKILIAADCTAYAYANMHEDFMKGKVTLIGCPKLDDIDYSEKLKEIISGNDIKSVTIVRMDVPCCGGLQRSAEKAIKESGKFIPWQVITISRNGEILED